MKVYIQEKDFFQNLCKNFEMFLWKMNMKFDAHNNLFFRIIKYFGHLYFAYQQFCALHQWVLN